jgi:hypothetical protein
MVPVTGPEQTHTREVMGNLVQTSV